MTEKFVTSPGLADLGPGERAVSRLADRLAAMAPASPAVAVVDEPAPAPRGWAPVAAPAVEPLDLRPLLLVLLSLGPGQISIDHVIRWLSGSKTAGTAS